MPGSLSLATVSPSSTVFPFSLSLSFVETQLYPLLSTTYHDGTLERSLITDGVNSPRPARTWSLSKRLTTTQLSTLRTFWETTVQGGLRPFYFYDPYDVAPGSRIGSNYDATGSSTQGRLICFLRGDWSEVTDLGRHNVPNLLLVEVL